MTLHCRSGRFHHPLLLAAVAALAGASVASEVVAPVRAQVSPAPLADLPATVVDSFKDASIVQSASPGTRPIQYFRAGDAFQPGGRWIASNITVPQLIQLAYAVPRARIVDGPQWLDSVRFDIVLTPEGNPADPSDDASVDIAVAPDGAAKAVANGVPSVVMGAIRALLADRFGLVMHDEQRTMDVYHLIAPSSAGGQGFAQAAGCRRRLGNPCGVHSGRLGRLIGNGASMHALARALELVPTVDRAVVDRTGLNGTFAFTLEWTAPVSWKDAAGRPTFVTRPADTTGASLFGAIERQLGLRLQASRDSVDAMVIDHVDRPVVTAN